jgi:hypothetical protein
MMIGIPPIMPQAAKPRRCPVLTAEQILSKLNELRKDYQEDDEPTPEFLALHHAFLFISYQMEAFKKYVAEENAKAQRKG